MIVFIKKLDFSAFLIYNGHILLLFTINIVNLTRKKERNGKSVKEKTS